ncbi:MAG: tRNA dimethylallyltransferase, partial [Bdellovibrionales bacterium]
ISAHVKAQIQEWTINKQLFAELKTRDVEAALKIGEADSYRLGRALEIVLTLGKTMKQVEVEFRLKSIPLSEKYNVSKIGFLVERSVLRKIIQQRTEKMLSQGLVEEVDQLIKKGFAKSKAMSSVGYKDCQNYLTGQISQSELKDAIITSTMQLAKKQMTWFKRDPKIEWREGFYKQT